MNPVPLGYVEPDAIAERRRWVLSGTAVIVAHAVLAALAAWWLAPVTSIITSTPPALMIDLAPLPATPAAPIPPSPPQPRVVTPPRPVKPPPPVPTAAVSLPAAPEPPPRPRDETPPRETPPRETTAPPPAAGPPVAEAAPAATSNAAPTWQGLLLGRLERFKRYPAQALSHAQQGVAYLRFTMNRDGEVLSARIERSSGVDLLDAETLALIQRAQPLPKPPPEVPGDRIELVVPIEFFVKARR